MVKDWNVVFERDDGRLHEPTTGALIAATVISSMLSIELGSMSISRFDWSVAEVPLFHSPLLIGNPSNNING